MYNELEALIGEKIGYKKITEVLSLPYYSGGNAKKNQLKDIQRFYTLESTGKKYLIVNKVENPDKKVDGRVNNGGDRNSKYYSDIELILLYLLQHENKQTILCSKGRALEIVNMINKNYRIARGNIMDSSDIMDVDSDNLRSFFDKYHRGLISIFENALKKMENQSLIHYDDKCIMVAKRNVVPKLNVLGEIELDKDNKPKLEITEEHYLASDSEIALILNMEEKVMADLGFSSKQQVMLSGSWNTFSRNVNSNLLKSGNIKYYYSAYKIICNENGLARKIEGCEYDDCRFNLNDNIIDKLKLSIEKKNDKGEIDQEYLINTYRFIEDLIDLDTDLKLQEEIYRIKNNTRLK